MRCCTVTKSTPASSIFPGKRSPEVVGCEGFDPRLAESLFQNDPNGLVGQALLVDSAPLRIRWGNGTNLSPRILSYSETTMESLASR